MAADQSDSGFRAPPDAGSRNPPRRRDEAFSTASALARRGQVNAGAGAALENTLPPTPLKDVLAAEGASVYVFSSDMELVNAVQNAGGEQYPIVSLDEWPVLIASVENRRTHIVLLDAEAVAGSLADAVDDLHAASSSLVVLAAARRDEAQSMMGLLSDRRIHRLLIKPAAHGITRLLLESAVARYLQMRESPEHMPLLQPAPRRKRRRGSRPPFVKWAAAAGIAVAIGAAAVYGLIGDLPLPWRQDEGAGRAPVAAAAAGAGDRAGSGVAAGSVGSAESAESTESAESAESTASVGAVESAESAASDGSAESAVDANLAGGVATTGGGDARVVEPEPGPAGAPALAVDASAGALEPAGNRAANVEPVMAAVPAVESGADATAVETGAIRETAGTAAAAAPSSTDGAARAAAGAASVDAPAPLNRAPDGAQAAGGTGATAAADAAAATRAADAPGATGAVVSAGAPAEAVELPDPLVATELEGYLTLARTRLRQDRLLQPAGDSARDYLARAAALSDTHPDVVRFRADLAEAVAATARLALDIGSVEQASRFAGEAASLGADPEILALLEIDLAAARAGQDVERRERLLADGIRRLEQGRLLGPADDGALSYLGALRAEAPDFPGLEAPWQALLQRLTADVRRAADAGDWQAAANITSALAATGAAPEQAADLEAEWLQARYLATPSPAGTLRLLESVPPEYPESSRRLGVEGWVDVDFVVDTEGRTRDVTVLDSQPRQRFDEAAIEAIRQQRYEPFELDGRRYARRLQLRVRFSLD